MIFTIPLFTILPGIFVGLNYGSFEFLPFVAVTAFTYINYFIYLTNEIDLNNEHSTMRTLLSAVSIGIIIYLSFRYSFFISVNLIFALLLVHTKQLFHHYNLNLLHVVIVLAFHLVIFNLISFYLIAGFITGELFTLLIPLLIPTFLYQEKHYFKSEQPLASMLVFVTVGIALVIMVFVVHWWALLIPFSIAITYYIQKQFKINFIDTFIFIFYLIQLLLIIVY